MPDYNRIVWLYDFMVGIFFGQKLEDAKKANLEFVNDRDRILVIGGGTGSILDYLNNIGFKLKVDYLDISYNMLVRARNKKLDNIKVQYFQKSILDFQERDYDIIITNFFFDQFNQPLLNEILLQVEEKLKPKGFLLFSDFVESSNLFDKTVVSIMIWFLQLTAALKITKLPDYEASLLHSRFEQIKEFSISRNIKSAIYRLPKR